MPWEMAGSLGNQGKLPPSVAWAVVALDPVPAAGIVVLAVVVGAAGQWYVEVAVVNMVVAAAVVVAVAVFVAVVVSVFVASGRTATSPALTLAAETVGRTAVAELNIVVVVGVGGIGVVVVVVAAVVVVVVVV